MFTIKTKYSKTRKWHTHTHPRACLCRFHLGKKTAAFFL